MPIYCSRGFTIVELLIVVVVIAILAAIIIVAYNGITQRATQVSLKSDLSGAGKVLQNDKTLSGNDTFPSSTTTANSGKGIMASNGASYQYTVHNGLNPTGFCLTETIGNVSYFIDQTNIISIGACPGHGANGVIAISNYDTGNSASTSYSGAVSGGTLTSGMATMPFATGSKFYGRAAYTTASSSRSSYVCAPTYSSTVGTVIGSPVTGSQQYTFSAYANPSWSGTQAQLIIRPFDASQNALTTSTSTAVTLNASQCQRLTYTYTMPSNATVVGMC